MSKLQLTKKEFKHLTSGIYALDTKDIRENLRYLYLNGNNEPVNDIDAVCTDGYKMSLRGIEGKFFDDNILLEVELIKMINSINFNIIIINTDNDNISIMIDNHYIINSPKINYNYVKYQLFIPDKKYNINNECYCTSFDINSMLDVLKNTSKNQSIKLLFEKNTIKVSSMNLDNNYSIGESCKRYNENLFSTGINATFLKNTLKYFKENKDNKIYFTSEGELKPLYFTNNFSSDKINLKLDVILPVREFKGVN